MGRLIWLVDKAAVFFAIYPVVLVLALLFFPHWIDAISTVLDAAFPRDVGDMSYSNIIIVLVPFPGFFVPSLFWLFSNRARFPRWDRKTRRRPAGAADSAGVDSCRVVHLLDPERR